ncbi:MAG: tRNA adenosine(34) deaminase TadA [bacterium]
MVELLQRDDEAFMRLALRQAKTAAATGEVPVGAVAVAGGQVIGRAHNQVELLKDGTAHAEMLALTQAAAACGGWRLNEVTLYVTKEPCMMCAGAMVNTRLGRLVFGCADPRSGAAGSVLTLTDQPGMLHTVPVTGGVLADLCLELIQDFFRRRRDEARATD